MGRDTIIINIGDAADFRMDIVDVQIIIEVDLTIADIKKILDHFIVVEEIADLITIIEIVVGVDMNNIIPKTIIMIIEIIFQIQTEVATETMIVIILDLRETIRAAV